MNIVDIIIIVDILGMDLLNISNYSTICLKEEDICGLEIDQ